MNEHQAGMASCVSSHAVGQEVIVNEALESGASAYIVKPFSEEKVLEIVSSALQNSAETNE